MEIESGLNGWTELTNHGSMGSCVFPCLANKLLIGSEMAWTMLIDQRSTTETVKSQICGRDGVIRSMLVKQNSIVVTVLACDASELYQEVNFVSIYWY